MMLGGLLAGALAGGAKAVGDVAQDELESQRRTRERQLQYDYELRKTEWAEQLKSAREEVRAKREATQAAAIDDKAESTLKEQEWKKFRADLGNSDMPENELRQVFESQYYDKQVTDEQGGDRYDVKETTRAKEKLNQARQSGASSGLLKTYMDEAKAAVKDENDKAEIARKERADKKREEERTQRSQKEDDQREEREARRAAEDSSRERNNSRMQITALIQSVGRQLEQVNNQIRDINRSTLKPQPGSPEYKDYQNLMDERKQLTSSLRAYEQSLLQLGKENKTESAPSKSSATPKITLPIKPKGSETAKSLAEKWMAMQQ